jgi:hypothetical protein
MKELHSLIIEHPSYYNNTHIKFPQPTPWRHRGRAEVWLHTFLTSAVDGGDWPNHVPASLTPVKITSTNWIRGYVGLRACLDVCRREKSLVSAGIRTPCLPVHSQVAILITLSRPSTIPMYSAYLLWLPWAPQLPLYVPADAGCVCVCDEGVVVGMAIKEIPSAAAVYTYRVAGHLVALSLPNNDFDIVHAFCYITILNGSLRKLDVIFCLCWRMESASRLSTDQPVRLPGYPSIFPSSACLLRRSERLHSPSISEWRAVNLVWNDNYKLYPFTKTRGFGWTLE